METKSSNDYRYERKFVVSEFSIYEIELLIKCHPAMFSEIYPPRFVNNLYLDSIDKENFFDAVHGINRRYKVRIRWYGGLFGLIEKPILEIKIKEGHVGRKEQYPLDHFSIGSGFQHDVITNLLNNSPVPGLVRSKLLTFENTLLNRYKRKYYQSADKKFRITVDTGLQFYRIRNNRNSFTNKIEVTATVVELKYSRSNDEYASRITNYFPFRLSKSSKYLSGLSSQFS